MKEINHPGVITRKTLCTPFTVGVMARRSASGPSCRHQLRRSLIVPASRHCRQGWFRSGEISVLRAELWHPGLDRKCREQVVVYVLR